MPEYIVQWTELVHKSITIELDYEPTEEDIHNMLPELSKKVPLEEADEVWIDPESVMWG